MNNFLRINMSKQKISNKACPKKYKFIGGRLLTSTLIAEEVPPEVPPFSEKNKLIIAPGSLGGTSAPSAGRLSIGSKSPLTKGIKESNAGGVLANKLSRLGYKAVIIEGKAEENRWYILKIAEEKVRLISTDKIENIIGVDNYQSCKILQKKFGKENGFMLIGPGGERKLPIATCAVTDRDGFPSRQAARGGLGAVMGSKGLKAVVVDDSNTSKINYKNKAEFQAMSKEWAQELVKNKKSLTKYGTAILVNAMNEVGGLATKNFSQGTFSGAKNLSGERLAEIQEKRNGKATHSCMPGCVIRCSNIFHDEGGEFLTASLEFETITLLGSNLGIDNLDLIAEIDRFCDGFGIDTMDFGGALAVAMENDYLSFGDEKALRDTLEEVQKATLMGKLLTQGVKTTGKVLGVDRVPEVKGQGISAYDPRALKGTGVTYATSPMGADHTAGNCLPGREGFTEEGKRNIEPQKAEGKIVLSREMQIMSAMCDALGICLFIGTSYITAKKTAKLMTALYDKNFSPQDMLNFGRKTIATELEFNKKAGIGKFQNRLPNFFRKEKLPNSGLTWNIEPRRLQDIFVEL